ncbi:methylated-DNA--[protein]-cysteine S-methyltransferase [Pseudomonas sp. gcc21]|uniref:methylated-DNA--[protein]-cysteine S-methyltransferase n=1 Tax=Pseudomonas sp. gcc21 TaxID=2726989 RepID=UPI0014529DF2|nr:methylated-DNA--[protein]-cysteine S-methyltransferase [Pseudomonas sp. gcc21]QJD58703.1 methylated-DNA--[protein]-cysteine S-methyltransferase [Pseudomonas sp. gcc21]
MVIRPLSIQYTTGRCEFGSLLYGVCESGICAILLGDDAQMLVDDLQRRFPASEIEQQDAALKSELAALLAYVDNPGQSAPALPRPLAPFGTRFQQQVWDVLSEVAAGQTITYSELARRCGKPTAMRAVAGACAANPLAIVVPCHRVLRSDGGISGYRWGVERKRSLIELEKRLAAEV